MSKSQHPPAFTEHPTQSPKKVQSSATPWRVIDNSTGVAACDDLATEEAATAEALRLAALAADPPRYTVVRA